MAIMCQLSQLLSELSKHPVLQESSESKLSQKKNQVPLLCSAHFHLELMLNILLVVY